MNYEKIINGLKLIFYKINIFKNIKENKKELFFPYKLFIIFKE